MGRLIIVIVILLISGIIYLVKAGLGKVTGKKVNFGDESKKVMEKTARGVQWMNEQWENAKIKATTGKSQLILGNDLKDLTATEIIVKIKRNPSIYDLETAENAYIEYAVHKMNNRQFDDAEKLIMQLSGGEARNFMLNEIKEKRNL